MLFTKSIISNGFSPFAVFMGVRNISVIAGWWDDCKRRPSHAPACCQIVSVGQSWGWSSQPAKNSSRGVLPSASLKSTFGRSLVVKRLVLSSPAALLSQIFGAFWWVCAYPLSVSTILTLPPDAAILFLPVLRSLTQLPRRGNCIALRRVFHFLFRRGFLELLAQLWGNTLMVIFNRCFTPSTFYDSVICLGVWSSCHDQKKI